MEEAFSIFGISFKDADILLLIVCPIFGSLGSIIGVAANQHTLFVNSSIEKHVKLSSIDLARIESISEHLKDALERLYSDSSRETIDKAIRVMSDSRGAIICYHGAIVRVNKYIDLWNQNLKPKVFLHIILGFGLGLAISLYFFGAVQANTNFIARLCLACLLLGYQAPKVWLLQENIIASALEQRLRTVLENLEVDTQK